MPCFVMFTNTVCILFLFKPLIRVFTIQRRLFWPRSQQVGDPIHYNLLACLSIIFSHSWISIKYVRPWCTCLGCKGWLRNARRFIKCAEPLYYSWKLFVLRRFRFRRFTPEFLVEWKVPCNCLWDWHWSRLHVIQLQGGGRGGLDDT